MWHRQAFTLIELMVVVGIIVLLAVIAVPSVGSILASNHQTQAMQTLTGALTVAQARAENRGGYAIRIERAFATNKYGFMLDTNGNASVSWNTDTRALEYNGNFAPANAPVWLDYQQIRFLQPPVKGPYYTPALDEVIPLPKGVWLAPDYAVNSAFNPAYYDSNKYGNPVDPTTPLTVRDSTSTNPFETFTIVFNQRGEVIEARPMYGINGAPSDNYQYQDQTQSLDSSLIGQLTSYPYPSARGVIMYDREKFLALANSDPTYERRAEFLAKNGRPLYINRFLGSLVEGGK